ncbi:MAG: CoA-binding protein [Pseudomonadota bacterium]
MGGKSDMKRFLEPRSVAVIGASRKLGDGANVVENLINYGYNGRIYPVNPFAQEICGIKAYPDVKNLPEDIDLAVILTSRDLVLEIIRECAKKRIKAIIIVGVGYADADEQGRKLQLQLVELARQNGIRIVGPNTFGVANGFTGLYTAFAPFPIGKIPVGLISQTGFFFASTPYFKLVGKAVDLGNACDISFAEVLEYYEKDEDVNFIVIYLETIKEGRRFMEVAGRVARKKPIIALRGGKTDQGRQAVMGHTGALAGSEDIYSAVFKKSGIIQADSTTDIEDFIVTFSSLPLMKGKRVGIMTYPMATGILSVDACARYGLNVPELSPQTVEKIGRLFPPWAPCANPMDLTAAVFVMGNESKSCFEMIMQALLIDPEIDAILFISPALPDYSIYDYSEIVSRLSRIYNDKPIVSYLYSPDPERIMARKYEDAGGAVVFPSLDRALKALAMMSNYWEFLNNS